MSIWGIATRVLLENIPAIETHVSDKAPPPYPTLGFPGYSRPLLATFPTVGATNVPPLLCLRVSLSVSQEPTGSQSHLLFYPQEIWWVLIWIGFLAMNTDPDFLRPVVWFRGPPERSRAYTSCHTSQRPCYYLLLLSPFYYCIRLHDIKNPHKNITQWWTGIGKCLETY